MSVNSCDIRSQLALASDNDSTAQSAGAEHTLSTTDGQNFPLAFADMNSGNGGDSEIIASE
jgi:hypothetical protein